MSTVFVKDYSGPEKNRLHVRLADFYTTNAPSNFLEMEEVIRMPITEAQLFLKLCEKYKCSVEAEAARAKSIGVYPAQTSLSSSNSASTEFSSSPTSEFKRGPVHEYSTAERNRLRIRLTNFYKKYAPDNMVAVEKALVVTFPEKDLFRGICSKYNCAIETEAAEAKAEGVYPNQQASNTSSLTSSPAEISAKFKLIGKIFDSYLAGDSFTLPKQDAFAALCQHAPHQNGILDVFSVIQNHSASEINRSAFFSIAAKFFAINNNNNESNISSKISSKDFCELVRTGTLENVKNAIEVFGFTSLNKSENVNQNGDDRIVIPHSVNVLSARRDTRTACEILTYLLERGADVNGGGDQNSCGPLFVTVSNSNVEGCKILLKFGVDLWSRGAGGMTPMHQAAFLLVQSDAKDSSEAQVLNLLLSAICTANLKKNNDWFKLQENMGNTVLHAAAYSSSEVALKTVLSKMKKEEIEFVKQMKNKEGKTFVEVAVEQGSENALRGFI